MQSSSLFFKCLALPFVLVRSGIRSHKAQGVINRTLITLIRKTLVNSADWKQDLKLLLFYYNTRPHGSTHLPPMETMFGWQPRSFIVDGACANTS